MKKILALILVVCLALGCFAGCKKDKETKTTKKPTATTSAPATTAPAESVGTEESETPAESETPTDETEVPADETETPADETEAPAGDWEMPDNSDIDCLAVDFRNGQISYDEYADGYAYLQAGENSNNNVYLEGVDPDGAAPGYLAVEIVGEDPYVYIYDFGEFELQDYPFVKIVLKNNTAVGAFQLFMFEQGGMCTGGHALTVEGLSATDSEFKTYIIDLRASGASNTLTVVPGTESLDRMFSAVRFDAPDTEGSMDIQYIGFFTSLEDAQAYK